MVRLGEYLILTSVMWLLSDLWFSLAVGQRYQFLPCVSFHRATYNEQLSTEQRRREREREKMRVKEGRVGRERVFSVYFWLRRLEE